MGIRTDLALDAHELWRQSTGEQTAHSGVWAQEKRHRGVRITTVKILDEDGVKRLHKPIGTYLTLEIDGLRKKEQNGFRQTVLALAAELEKLIGERDNVLVVGLGNEAVTPDAVGPKTLRSVIVTRHLKDVLKDTMRGFRTVSTAEPGVLGTTGIESAELVRALVRDIRPEAVIVVDALASSSPSRICASIQLTDTGIVPGSGVGNSRAAFNEASLGVPVIAVGVPTVMDAGEEGMIVIPRDIDARVREIGKVIGYALDLALHRGLHVEDIPAFLS